MDLGLKNKVAVISGASRGIGMACAREFLAEGATVVVVSRNAAANAAAAQEFERQYPGKVLGIPTDLDDDGSVAAMAEQAVKKLGRIDVLVNAAATVIPDDFFKMTDKYLTSMFDQKFNGVARCIRHVVPDMRKRKWGRIISISGLAGRQPHFQVIPAAVNNAAVLNLTKALAAELAKDNILVNAVAPHIIDTERQEDTMVEWAKITGQSVEEVRKQRMARIPIGRMGRPDEVAAMVAFLASERAGFMTGSAYYVDGGVSLSL